MAVRIELLDDAAACSTCGAGTVVASGFRPEYVKPLPHGHDADLAAEMAGMEGELHELLDDVAPVAWWVKRKARQEAFAAQVGDIVNAMKQRTAHS